MNEWEFMKAFTDIEDNLILDAKKPFVPKTGKYSVLGKIGVAAAILCLLSISVMAVSFGVRIMGSDTRVPIGKYAFLGIFAPSSKVTTVDYALHSQKIHIPPQWQESLTEAWKSFPYDKKYFQGIDLRNTEGERIDFHGISEIEDVLGLSVVSSSEIREIVRSTFVKLVVTDPERAEKEFAERGEISPDGIEIYLPFTTVRGGELDPQIVDYCGLSLYIPLTESFANRYRSHVALSGVGDQDLVEQKLVSQRGIEFLLLYNTISQEEPMQVYAAWEHEGVGYLLEMRTHHDITMDKEPAEMILPYLENLEE